MSNKRKIGPFELERRVGVGGMGVVYRASYRKTGQKVALKVLSPALSSDEKLLARFEREMEILKKLRHPNIVRYYGGGKAGSQQFYAMEFMTGGSLEDLLRQKGRLPWEQAIELGLQIVQALEHAHNHGVVHRDLKPANLFFAEDGTLRLGDFGIARDTRRTALTAAGKTVGTYAYMAPEQISGKWAVSSKTDLYALGCVLFEMLTGHPPFEADNPAEMFYQHLEKPPPRVTAEALDCPVWLEAVVLKLLEKNPEDRYYDALAVQVALEDVGTKVAEQESLLTATGPGGGTASTAGPTPEVKRLLGKKKKKRKKKRRHVPFYERAWFLVACLLVLIGGIVWLMQPPGQQELWAEAQPLIDSDNTVKWVDARDDYLQPLLERFPEGKYADEAQEAIDEIEMKLAERRAEVRAEHGRPPKSEPERLYREAREYEKFGDRVTALRKYRSMVNLLQENEDLAEAETYLNLARRQIAAIERSDGGGDRLQIVNDALRRAEEHYQNGRVLEARKIWNSVVALYADNREFEPQVNYARARLDGREVELPDFDADESSPGAKETDAPSGVTSRAPDG